MANFSHLTLVQGLEEILTNPKFPEGKDIVSTLQQLISEKRIVNEGKVATIISERTYEGEPDDSEIQVSERVQASSEPMTPTAQSDQVSPIPELPRIPTLEFNAPQLGSQEVELLKRIQALPERYHHLLGQLLQNWEKQ